MNNTVFLVVFVDFPKMQRKTFLSCKHMLWIVMCYVVSQTCERFWSGFGCCVRICSVPDALRLQTESLTHTDYTSACCCCALFLLHMWIIDVFSLFHQDGGLQISAPASQHLSVPLFLAWTASSKTVVANPIVHLTNLTHDILHTINALDAPPHPDIVNNEVKRGSSEWDVVTVMIHPLTRLSSFCLRSMWCTRWQPLSPPASISVSVTDTVTGGCDSVTSALITN